MRNSAHPASRVLPAVVLASVAILLPACGSDDDNAADAPPPSTAAPPVPTTTTTAGPAATAAPSTDPSETTSTTVADTIAAPSDEELSEQLEGVLTQVITSIRWNKQGVDAPPTAAVAAVRIPGRDDVLVAVGENVDGSPVDAEAPFPVASLTESLVRTVAFQMIDDGVLDPTRTVDQWAPTLPNADRVTVQMLVDDTTGWSEEGPIEPDPVVTDFQRAWTLREGVELRATTMTALAEPGTRTNDAQTNAAVLGLVVEDVGGRPLAELVGDMLETAGLNQTGLLDGRTIPDRYRHGVFAFNGAPSDTSAFGGTSFLTWNQATTSAVSTPTDLLDLLDLWETGALFTTDRTSAPERYAPEPTGRTDFVPGVDVPFNGFCPCTAVDGGIEPVAIGRAPATVGTKSYLWRYADGISIVFNVNSNEPADTAEVDAVMTTLHDIAAQAGS